MNRVVVTAPAKLNLALDVTGLAPNGYHTVDMIMQAIGLYEQVEITKSMGYSLRCPQSPVPTNEKNTATKAAGVFFRETGLLAGADITIHKVVPVRAGLAGGSADAAAVLVGLNALYGARLSMAELCELGAMVGSDVPFALLGGTARVTGTGTTLTALAPLPPCWFTVAMPSGGGVSTPAVYKRYDEVGSPVHPDVSAAATAIVNGDFAGLIPHMTNALERASGDETTLRLRQALDAAGAAASMMTGSGAAVFGLFWEKETADTAAEHLRSLTKQVFVASPVPFGAQVQEAT